MSLKTQIENVVVRIGTEFKSVRTSIGNLPSLTTTDKSSLVGAVNELAGAIAAGGGAQIDDAAASISKVYSSSKTVSLINAKPSIDDVTASLSKVYSSTKVDNLISTAIGSRPALNDTTASPTTVYSSTKTNSAIATAIAALPVIDDTNASSTSLYSSSKINAAITSAVSAKTEINDGAPSTSKVWSSTKTNSEIGAAVSALVSSAPTTLDTLSEIATALGNDANFSTTITTALGNRLRVDAAQALTGPQQAQGRTNLDVYSKTEIGDVAANFVTTFEAALV